MKKNLLLGLLILFLISTTDFAGLPDPKKNLKNLQFRTREKIDYQMKN